MQQKSNSFNPTMSTIAVQLHVSKLRVPYRNANIYSVTVIIPLSKFNRHQSDFSILSLFWHLKQRELLQITRGMWQESIKDPGVSTNQTPKLNKLAQGFNFERQYFNKV